jgi:phage I-like protein
MLRAGIGQSITGDFKDILNMVLQEGAMGKQGPASQSGTERIILPVALNFQVGESGLPARIDLVPAGSPITGVDGRSWSNPSPQGVVDWLEQRGHDLVLDFEHASELKAPKGEPAPAAAWLHEYRVEPDGRVTAAVKTWTPAGEAAVLNREYRYISPALRVSRYTGAILGVDSVGLTNKPNLVAITALNHEQEEDTTMLKKMLKALGLPEDASEETALNAVTKLQTDVQTALNSAAIPSLDKFVPRADYEIALNRAKAAEDKIAEDDKAKLEDDIETVLNQALAKGKIAPASKEFYTAVCQTEGGVEQFRKFLASAPILVADSGLGGKVPPGEQTALNADQTKIMEMFGNTPEDIAKFGK